MRQNALLNDNIQVNGIPFERLHFLVCCEKVHLVLNTQVQDRILDHANRHASQTNQQLIIKNYPDLMHHLTSDCDAETAFGNQVYAYGAENIDYLIC